MEFQFPRQAGICEKFLISKTFRLYLRNFHRITSSFFCSGLETQNHALINFIKFKNLFLSGSAINGYKFARFQCAYMQSFKTARNLSSQELLSTVTREQLWSDSSCRSSSSGPWLRSDPTIAKNTAITTSRIYIASRTDQKPQEESPPVLQGSSTRVKSELAQNI